MKYLISGLSARTRLLVESGSFLFPFMSRSTLGLIQRFIQWEVGSLPWGN